jgi:hypothetical protein
VNLITSATAEVSFGTIIERLYLTASAPNYYFSSSETRKARQVHRDRFERLGRVS